MIYLGNVLMQDLTLLRFVAADDATPAKKIDRKSVIDEAHGDLSA